MGQAAAIQACVSVSRHRCGCGQRGLREHDGHQLRVARRHVSGERRQRRAQGAGRCRQLHLHACAGGRRRSPHPAQRQPAKRSLQPPEGAAALVPVAACLLHHPADGVLASARRRRATAALKSSCL